MTQVLATDPAREIDERPPVDVGDAARLRPRRRRDAASTTPGGDVPRSLGCDPRRRRPLP